jgi:hypothetical protein
MADRAEDDIRVAVAGLAYHFVMLEEVVRRVSILELKHRAPPATEATTGPDQVIFELSSTTFGYGRPRAEIRKAHLEKTLDDLTEYRTYLELSLLLARKVNDVVSPKTDRREDDVALSDFTGSNLTSLDTVEDGLLRRINKLAAHQTYYAGSKEWPIADIGRWAAKRRAEVGDLLTRNDPDLALVFESSLVEYGDEVAGDGWSP